MACMDGELLTSCRASEGFTPPFMEDLDLVLRLRRSIGPPHVLPAALHTSGLPKKYILLL